MSSAHNNVFDTVNDRSNISDPKNTNDLDRTFVYKNDPWSKGQDYEGYPYIIVRFPKMEKSKLSGDGNTKNFLWECEVTVRTAMEGAINDVGESTGISNMNSILDDLNETFDSKTVKDELRALGMFSLEYEIGDNDEVIDSNGKHIFVCESTIKFYNRLKVGV